MIADKLEQAKINPEKDYHLKSDIRRVLRWIDSDADYSDRIEAELEELEENHPFASLIKAIVVWDESDGGDFNSGIQAALTALDDMYDLSRENKWNSVASFSLLKSIEYREELGGFRSSEKFDEVLSFHEDVFSSEGEVSLVQFKDHVTKMIDHIDEMDEECIESLLRLIRVRAEQLQEDRDYISEREFLWFEMKVREHLERDVSKVESRLVESFEDELELKSTAPSYYRADVLERAVSQCKSFLSDEMENEWRLEIRRLNREAKGEMTKQKIEFDVGDRAVEIVDAFKQAQGNSSSWEALGMLLFAPVGMPDYEKMLDIVAKNPAGEVLPKNILSLKGDSVGFEPGLLQEGERTPSNYVQELFKTNHALALAIHKLINRGQICESDFYLLLTTISGLSIQDEAFLTDAIMNLFEGNYAEAIHLAIPRLESVTANVYEEMGQAVTKNQGQIYEQRGLGGLFGLIEEDVSRNFGKYLQQQYTDTSGNNIRNLVAHGQIRYSATDVKLAITVIFDIYRTAGRISAAYEKNTNQTSGRGV